MPDHPPPPSRRDHEPPAASHHGPPPDDRLRDAYLAEMWPVCRELPRHEREERRKEERREQREMEDRRLSAGLPPLSPDISTGCAETAPGKDQVGSTKCA